MCTEPVESFRIRTLESSDLAAVAQFEYEIARISFPEDPISDLRFYEQRISKFIGDKKAGAFVAERAGHVIGWALVAERENFGTKKKYGDFRSLYVAETDRRSGVAAALMHSVLEFCESRRLASIAGRTSYRNHAMRAIYDAYDFEPKHVIYELQLEREAADQAG